jgi:hypothetical protein
VAKDKVIPSNLSELSEALLYSESSEKYFRSVVVIIACQNLNNQTYIKIAFVSKCHNSKCNLGLPYNTNVKNDCCGIAVG